MNSHTSQALSRFLSLACFFAVCFVPFQAGAQAGAIYTAGNTKTNNEVYAYSRATNGTLSFIGTYATQGNGNGSAVMSQSSVALSPDHKFLFVVNTGSATIASFAVQPDYSLVFVGTVSSSGKRPASLTIFGNLLYVANKGTLNGTVSPNIVGFTIAANGALTEIPNSAVNLSSATASPGNVAFNNDGTLLVVTETGNNNIDTFTVAANGLASGPLVLPSNNAEPYGFAFDNLDHLILAEGATSSMSSYSISSAGVLTPISVSVKDNGGLACWVVNTNNSTYPTQYSYAANTGSGTVSSYAISPTGALTLLQSKAATGVSNARDMVLAANSTYFYVLTQFNQEIKGYSVKANGKLTFITAGTGLPPSGYGLAGF
jgi:6-phosphogluconolactonase